MDVEIITIGNELLIGQVVDTNSAWMGQALNDAGFDVSRITSIQDTKEAIDSTLKEAMLRSKIVLMTGGLGPTKDDITKQVLADFFNSKLVFSEEAYANVKAYLKGRVKGVNKLNQGQAYVPECCEVINNPIGTAPVMWFEKEGRIVVSMPGVPSEMKMAMSEGVIPRLKATFDTIHIIHKTIQVFNVPEAILAERLEEWELGIPDFISLAYLPSPGKVRLRLTAKTNDKALAKEKLVALSDKLYTVVGEHIFAEEDKTAQELLAEALSNTVKTLAVAESCTGGNIGHLITSIPGSSVYFRGGIIAYDNQVKERLLGVESDILEAHGAVSQQVVEAMAEGVRQSLNTDYGIATSGIAGPDGGTADKPIGTVWIAISGDFGVMSKCYNFGKIRARNIQRSSDVAMIMLLKKIKTDG